jgi:hypothetical protein
VRFPLPGDVRPARGGGGGGGGGLSHPLQFYAAMDSVACVG